ncbi:MAG: hypothetical protein ACOCP8_00985 [archaeon]
MEKEQIQKNIDEAVKVFRETLEKTFLEKEKPFYGIGIHSYTGFLRGKQSVLRLSNGNLKISGEIDKMAFRKECKGLPRKNDDFAIIPMVVTLFQEDFK